MLVMPRSGEQAMTPHRLGEQGFAAVRRSGTVTADVERLMPDLYVRSEEAGG